MFRFGIRAKFILVTTALLLLIFGATAFILVERNTSTLRRNLDEQSQAFAALATKPIGDSFALYKDSGRIRILQQVNRFTELNTNIANAAVINLQGEVLFSQKPWEISISTEAASSFEPYLIYNSAGELTTIVYPFNEDFGLHRYAVAYEISYAQLAQAERQVVNSILLLSLFALVFTSFVTYLLVNRLILKPMRQVSQSALAISAGDLERQIQLERKDEIADLANAVNMMATTLKEDIRKLRQVDEMKSEFLAITSHNLRTPLTIISGYVETMQKLEIAADAKKMLQAISASNARLLGLTEDILTIAQIEAGREVFDRVSMSFDEFLSPILDEFKSVATQKNIKLAVNGAKQPLVVSISPAHFRTAVWNLLDNALKFTDAGGTITVSTRQNRQSAELEVADTGIGIPTEEVERLFTKFHRGTGILTYNYEGEGIGLYITKLIIDQHNGQVNVRSKSSEGTTFTIILPLSTAADDQKIEKSRSGTV